MCDYLTSAFAHVQVLKMAITKAASGTCTVFDHSPSIFIHLRIVFAAQNNHPAICTYVLVTTLGAFYTQ